MSRSRRAQCKHIPVVRTVRPTKDRQSRTNAEPKIKRWKVKDKTSSEPFIGRVQGMPENRRRDGTDSWENVAQDIMATAENELRMTSGK